MQSEYVILGGGCFWCLEAVFARIPGVISAAPGYAGGEHASPSYESVCSGTTGHAEVVRLEFDPSKVSFAELIELFFRAHDPTTLNRQGHDVGTQYRSVVFYVSPEQRQLTEHAIEQAAQLYSRPVVTQVLPAPEFYPAESYHHDYYAKNPQAGYCRMIIAPKLSKLKLE
ncbi:MAG: peptide-methionine (S)-S-oxide reductase MsrA [Spirochaeta sp.]|nr:peptide-methionine (S)-S-oxide reductase MsrA [Spirochaeta sp.]